MDESPIPKPGEVPEVAHTDHDPKAGEKGALAGGAGGALYGAAMGSLGGPVGALIGGTMGAIAGSLIAAAAVSVAEEEVVEPDTSAPPDPVPQIDEADSKPPG